MEKPITLYGATLTTGNEGRYLIETPYGRVLLPGVGDVDIAIALLKDAVTSQPIKFGDRQIAALEELMVLLEERQQG